LQLHWLGFFIAVLCTLGIFGNCFFYKYLGALHLRSAERLRCRAP
jgi:hypothetical protein